MSNIYNGIDQEDLVNAEEEMDFYDAGNQECIRCGNRAFTNERKLCNECYELWG